MSMGETVSSLEMDVLNPLDIKEVLELILGFCKLKDLKSCRLVSTFWRECSIKAFKSFPIKLTYSAKTREFVRLLQDPRPVAGSRIALYTNFILSNSSLTLSRQLATFWALTGPQIKFLELSDIKPESVDQIRKIVLNICSNLKEFILRNVSMARPSNLPIYEPTKWEAPQFGQNQSVKKLTINQAPGSLGISWMELLNYFPSLKALTLEKALPTHADLFKSLKVTREHNASLLDLNEIHFWYADQQTERREINELTLGVMSLADTNLQLRKLSLDLIGGISLPSEHTGTFEKHFLKSQEESLEKLTIRRNLRGTLNLACFFGGYNFLNLQELHLQSSLFTSMWILTTMPNLRKLSFCRANITADLESMVLGGFQLSKCLELNVNCKISLEGLKLLCKLVPNVERLKITGLANDVFSYVCERWPNLVELDIVKSEVDECGITGMDLDHVKKINDMRGKSETRPNTELRANITNLKHLRNFCLQAAQLSSGVPSNNFLGYCGKLHGFEKMPDLEDLCIINYNCDKRAYKEIYVGGRKVRIIIRPNLSDWYLSWKKIKN